MKNSDGFVPSKTFSRYILLKKSANQIEEVAVVYHGRRRRSAPARSGAGAIRSLGIRRRPAATRNAPNDDNTKVLMLSDAEHEDFERD